MAEDSLPLMADWTAVDTLIEAVSEYSSAHLGEFQRQIEFSEKALAPFPDPLRHDLGLSRWLSSSREEAYSDWLAWIIEQLETSEILYILRCSNSLNISEYRGKPKCEREVTIPGGRLDIVIEFGSKARIVIEVKKTSEEYAATGKQQRYTEWLKRGEERGLAYSSLLLVTAAGEVYMKGFPKEFKALLWQDLCILLRQLLPGLKGRLGDVKGAMFIAFLSAEEINLLGCASLANPVNNSMAYARAASHIRRSLAQPGEGLL